MRGGIRTSAGRPAVGLRGGSGSPCAGTPRRTRGTATRPLAWRTWLWRGGSSQGMRSDGPPHHPLEPPRRRLQRPCGISLVPSHTGQGPTYCTSGVIWLCNPNAPLHTKRCRGRKTAGQVGAGERTAEQGGCNLERGSGSLRVPVVGLGVASALLTRWWPPSVLWT